jgi:hypothetical protein
MLTQYHRQICQQALESVFSPNVLEIIIQANISQDHIRGQIGHPEFHFDASAFEAGNAYLEEQRQIILDNLSSRADPTPAWQAFGRLTHAVQDFYAHSNYLALWAARFPKSELPAPPQVDALNPEISNHPEIRSGNTYLWDWLAFVPGLYNLALRILPADSHTHMNLDHPNRGWLFPYAIEAAVQRTRHEFELIAARIQIALGEGALSVFTDGRGTKIIE